MRSVVLMVAVGLLGVACALPAYEVDPSLGTGGAGGSGAGTAGSAGSSSAGMPGSAGSGGGEIDRESACITYCGIYVQACADHPANTYNDASGCVGVCANADWPFNPDPAPEVIMEGGSLQCRLTHAQFARDMGQEPHCWHASANPSMGACE